MSGWRPETGSYIAVLYYMGYPVTASPFRNYLKDAACI